MLLFRSGDRHRDGSLLLRPGARNDDPSNGESMRNAVSTCRQCGTHASPRTGNARTAAPPRRRSDRSRCRGRLQSADGQAPDRRENQLGAIVLITDRGIEHSRIEDACAAGTVAGVVGEQPPAIAAVVCDGVSTSAEGQNASRAASVAGVDAMLEALAASGDLTSVMLAGLSAAARAAANSTRPTIQLPRGHAPIRPRRRLVER